MTYTVSHNIKDEFGDEWTYRAFCIGVQHNGMEIRPPHQYIDGKLRIEGTSILCPSCYNLKKIMRETDGRSRTKIFVR